MPGIESLPGVFVFRGTLPAVQSGAGLLHNMRVARAARLFRVLVCKRQRPAIDCRDGTTRRLGR